MKKIIALALVAFMLFTVFACAKENNKEQGEGTKPTGDLPAEFENVDFENQEFVLATYRAATGSKIVTYSDLIADELNGDPINDAIYERNQNIQGLFNCTIVPYEPADKQTFKDILLAGNPDGIDAFFVNGVDFGPLVSEGHVYNLMDYADDLGLDNPWWHQDSNTSMTLNGRLYGAVGDFSARGLVAMPAIFFNKTMIEKYDSLENPYDLVRSGRWTIDVLAQYAKTMTDLGGNDTLEITDTVGMVTEWGSGYYYLSAAGVRGFTNDGSAVTYTMNTSDAQSMMTKIGDLLTDRLVSKIVVRDYNNDYTASGALGYFADQKIAFFSNYISLALELRDMEAEFGMLPLPKLSEKQTEYCSVGNRWNCSYAMIPLACDNDVKETALVLNAMAFYGNDLLKEAIYDRSFRSLKLLRDEDSVEMFELILKTQRHDMGILFNTVAYDTATYLIEGAYKAFSSQMQKREPTFLGVVDQLHEIYGVKG